MLHGSTCAIKDILWPISWARRFCISKRTCVKLKWNKRTKRRCGFWVHVFLRKENWNLILFLPHIGGETSSAKHLCSTLPKNKSDGLLTRTSNTRDQRMFNHRASTVDLSFLCSFIKSPKDKSSSLRQPLFLRILVTDTRFCQTRWKSFCYLLIRTRGTQLFTDTQNDGQCWGAILLCWKWHPWPSVKCQTSWAPTMPTISCSQCRTEVDQAEQKSESAWGTWVLPFAAMWKSPSAASRSLCLQQTTAQEVMVNTVQTDNCLQKSQAFFQSSLRW